MDCVRQRLSLECLGSISLRHPLSMIMMSVVTSMLMQVMTTSSEACGVNAHLWITDSAICQLPQATRTRALFEDQRRVDLTRLGSAFPDSGYAINHEYGEVAHWYPFIQAYIESFHDRHGAEEREWSIEAYDEVAFIMGVAAHGYEDELFDTQFLRWVSQEDDRGQDLIDPAVDLLLIHEGHTELLPPLEFPLESAVEALQRSGVEVSSGDVQAGVSRVHQFALGLSQTPEALTSLVERDAPLIPWTTRHYLNREISGSLAHEPQRVASLLDTIYRRLAGEEVAESVISSVDPSAPRTLDRAGVALRDESRWISLYFNTAVMTQSVLDSLSLSTVEGQNVSFESRSTRWGGGDGYTRIIELSPYDLPDSSTLRLELSSGIELINGEVTRGAQEYLIEICAQDRCNSPELPELMWGGRQRGCWVREALDLGMADQEMNHVSMIDLGMVDSEVNDISMTDLEGSDLEDSDLEGSDPSVGQSNDQSLGGQESASAASIQSGCNASSSKGSDRIFFVFCLGIGITLTRLKDRFLPQRA